MGRVVGFDFGLSRIGLAVSDASQIIASPLQTLQVPKNKELLLASMEKALAAYRPFDSFVVGLPLLLDGTSGEMAEAAKDFGKMISEHFHTPCFFWDERLSSLQADRFLREGSLRRKERAQKIDTLSACLILQNYLENKRLPFNQKN